RVREFGAVMARPRAGDYHSVVGKSTTIHGLLEGFAMWASKRISSSSVANPYRDAIKPRLTSFGLSSTQIIELTAVSWSRRQVSLAANLPLALREAFGGRKSICGKMSIMIFPGRHGA